MHSAGFHVFLTRPDQGCWFSLRALKGCCLFGNQSSKSWWPHIQKSWSEVWKMRAHYCFSKMQIYKSENHLYLVCLLSLAVRNVQYLIQTPKRILHYLSVFGINAQLEYLDSVLPSALWKQWGLDEAVVGREHEVTSGKLCGSAQSFADLIVGIWWCFLTFLPPFIVNSQTSD